MHRMQTRRSMNLYCIWIHTMHVINMHTSTPICMAVWDPKFSTSSTVIVQSLALFLQFPCD